MGGGMRSHKREMLEKERFDNVLREPVLVMLHVVARLLQEHKLALLVQSL